MTGTHTSSFNPRNFLKAFRGHAASKQPVAAPGSQLDSYGRNELHKAVIRNDLKLVKQLLKDKTFPIDAPATGENGKTALMLAAENGFVDILKYLLGKRADKEAQDIGGHTALILTADKSQVEAARLLLKAGAHRLAKNHQGSTARHIAALQKEACEPLRLSSHEKQLIQAEAMLQLLIDDEQKIHASVSSGRLSWLSKERPPLHRAASHDHIKNLNALITQGIRIDMPDTKGRTALLRAVSRGKAPAVQRLLTASADIEALSPKQQLTPLLLAVKKGHADIVKLLIEKGANIDAIDKQGHTCDTLIPKNKVDKFQAILNEAKIAKKQRWLGETTAIYLETSGPAAERIDYAWRIYQQESADSVYKQPARAFLMYAFNLTADADFDEKVPVWMTERAQYKVEYPDYIPGKTPKRMRDRWQATPGQEGQAAKIKQLIERGDIVTVNNESKEKDEAFGTQKLSRYQKALYQVWLHAGAFKQNGQLVDTTDCIAHNRKEFAAITWSLDGEIHLFNHKAMLDGMAHSSIQNSAPLLFSGTIKIVAGKLLGLTTHSGHYQPSLEHTRHFLKELIRQGIDISEAIIYSTRQPPEYIPSEYTYPFYTFAAQALVDWPEPIQKLKPVPHTPTIKEPTLPIKPPTEPQTLKTQIIAVLTGIHNSFIKALKQYQTNWFTRLSAWFSPLTQAKTGLAQSFSPITEFNDVAQVQALRTTIDTMITSNNQHATDHKKPSNTGRLHALLSQYLQQLNQLQTQAATYQQSLSDHQTYISQLQAYQADKKAYDDDQALYQNYLQAKQAYEQTPADRKAGLERNLRTFY